MEKFGADRCVISLQSFSRFVKYFGAVEAKNRDHVLERMNALFEVPGFVGFITNEKLNALLKDAKEGDYLLRFSNSKDDCIVLTMVYKENNKKSYQHEIIYLIDGMLISDEGSGFEMPVEQAQAFMIKFLYEHPRKPSRIITLS